jgi:glycosyltransferase involved in cell wall biosynthesis
MPSQDRQALVSVILPTYNRAAFLPAAFASIAGQTFADWELIVVDDGSSDDTSKVVREQGGPLGERVRYVHQTNRGAYAARNRGLDEARGAYIAFFDSDDVWLPHHLERCVSALEMHAEIDWAFGACRIVNHATGAVIEPSTFYPGGRPRAFLHLAVRRAGPLRIVDDPGMIPCQILDGLHCGLQNSVIRRRVFEGARFDETSRVVDDEIFVVRAMVKGARFAYYDDPHVIYHVHGDNSSAPAAGTARDREIGIFNELTERLERLRRLEGLDAAGRRAVRKRLGREYFWHLGYTLYWNAGRHAEALESYRRGLRVWPWDWRALKTFVVAQCRLLPDRARSVFASQR